MAKTIDLGWAKPDDPIYSSGPMVSFRPPSPGSMTSSLTQEERTSLWEAASQKLDAMLRASGRTVIEEPDTSDDAECLAIFPPNRRTDK
jgi:hypothetical protein